jgi:hypothetical protein
LTFRRPESFDTFFSSPTIFGPIIFYRSRPGTGVMI